MKITCHFNGLPVLLEGHPYMSVHEALLIHCEEYQHANTTGIYIDDHPYDARQVNLGSIIDSKLSVSIQF